jgi:hypothetical protein
MSNLLTVMIPALDAVVLIMVGALLWRLRRDPLATWQAQEQRLQEIFESLRLLAAQSEGAARELDGALSAREQRLRVLAAETTAATRSAANASREGDQRDEAYADVVARVRRLAAAALPPDEIARRVEMPAAEVRVLVGLHAEQREQRQKKRSEETDRQLLPAQRPATHERDDGRHGTGVARATTR